jgi:hypothetical protein
MHLQLVSYNNDVLEITLEVCILKSKIGTAGQMAMLNFEQENHD